MQEKTCYYEKWVGRHASFPPSRYVKQIALPQIPQFFSCSCLLILDFTFFGFVRWTLCWASVVHGTENKEIVLFVTFGNVFAHLHCKMKIGEVRIIHSTLRGLGFLLVASYIFWGGQRKIFKRWNMQQLPIISMHIIGSCCIFHLLNIFLWSTKNM